MADGPISCSACGSVIGFEAHRGSECRGLGDELAAWLVRFSTVRRLYVAHFSGHLRAFLFAPPRRF